MAKLNCTSFLIRARLTHKSKAYPTLMAEVSGEYWLVMIGLDGVMETAFPPDDPEDYLADPAFIYVGVMEELENNE